MMMSPLEGVAKWDYLTIPVKERGRLSLLGQEGWELIAIDADGHDAVLYLKRLALNFRERVTLEQRRAYFTARGLDPDDDKAIGPSP